MDASDWKTVAVTIVGGGGLAALLNTIISKRKISAEARNVEIAGELRIVDAATDLVEMMRKEITALSERTKRLEEKVDELATENRELENKVSQLKKENARLENRCLLMENENKMLRKIMEKSKE